MSSWYLIAASVVAASVAACGGRVVFESSSGSGGSIATSASHPTTAGQTSVATTVQASSTSTSAQGCQGSIDVAADNGAPLHWASSCFGTWGANTSAFAVGYLHSVGPQPISTVVEGCENGGDATQSPGIRIDISDASAPGMYMSGATVYFGPQGNSWSAAGGAPFKATITKMDPVGGYVDGSFSAIVKASDGTTHSLGGSFHVCRVQDELGQG